MIFTDRMKICLRDFADQGESWNRVSLTHSQRQLPRQMRIELHCGEIAFDEQETQLTLSMQLPKNRFNIIYNKIRYTSVLRRSSNGTTKKSSSILIVARASKELRKKVTIKRALKDLHNMIRFIEFYTVQEWFWKQS